MLSFYTMPKTGCFSLLMILMFARANSQCSSSLNCTIFVDPFTDCQIPPCTGNSSCDFIYNNLSHALVDLDISCTGNSVTVYLTAEEHFIEWYAHGIHISKDIIIQGQSNTMISCGNIGDDHNVNSLLLFYNTTTVELSNLEFNSCQRPIRFHNISKLTMSQCTFRYDYIHRSVHVYIHTHSYVYDYMHIISIVETFQMVLLMF